MPESFLAEMKRYVEFGPVEEAALRAFAPTARPHFARIADEFYERVARHPFAADVIAGEEQLRRLKGSLCEWMDLLLQGPWDEAYYQKRMRIGRMHVRISLPQRYMFGAMNAIRMALLALAGPETAPALNKILDVELAIMLESYREAFVDDVQQRERLEKSLLEHRLAVSEARYSEIVETAAALVAIVDGEGVIQFCNHQLRDVCGGDVRGQSFFERIVAEPARAAVRQAVARLREGATAISPFESPLGEHRVRWYLTALPSSGLPLVSALGVDVTEEHALALRTRRAERLASLGTMAAGLAHEIRNPLNAAHLQLTVLHRRLGRSPADVGGALHASELAAGEMSRLATLVEEFLHFARPQPLRLSRGDLRASSEVVVSLLQPQASEAGIDLAIAPGPSVWVEMDDEKIKQVLHNLLRNALEAAARGGRVRVRVGEAGGQAHLEVEDDGPGIPADAPIFEPFYTSKPAGTGLGLAIVLRIVGDHGGRIDTATRPGQTVFTVSLPQVQGTQILRVG